MLQPGKNSDKEEKGLSLETKIHKDINEYQEKILFGMSIRQLICALVSALLSVATGYIMTKKLAGNLFYCNLDNTDEHFVKFGKDYSLEDTDFTQWRELGDITITKTPALLTVQDGKIINYTEDCNEIKEYAES